MAIRDIKDYIKVLLYSYYTTITGWGVGYGLGGPTLPVIVTIRVNGDYIRVLL